MSILPKIKPVVVVNNKIYEGNDHGEAIKEASEDLEANREKIGKFLVGDKLMSRKQTQDKFGFSHSHELFEDGKPTIVIITKDFSGLGWAKMCVDAGYPTVLVYKRPEDEDNKDSYNLVGNGIVTKMSFEEFEKQKGSFKDSYILWDGNHNPEDNEKLIKEGFNILGGRELMYKMENDRNFGTSLVEKAGLKTPETQEFSDKQSGLDFLDKNKDRAFVFKPDEGAGTFTTYVPDARKPHLANRELYDYLESGDGDTGTYILQERKDGVELNVEYFMFDGKPFFAHCLLECKRKENNDEGCMVGCSQDIEFVIPLDCKIVRETLAKLIKIEEFKNFTGFLDMNLIVCDNEYYFLEFCGRFGYNAHPNLFNNLALKSFPELMIMFMDGKINRFYDNFKSGFGASVGLRIDYEKKGYPCYLPDDLKFYMYDQYKKGDKYYLAGYGKEVGMVFAHGYTIQTAAEQVLRDVDRVNYPNHSCRTDLDKRDYEQSPILRYEACESMKLFI